MWIGEFLVTNLKAVTCQTSDEISLNGKGHLRIIFCSTLNHSKILPINNNNYYY